MTTSSELTTISKIVDRAESLGLLHKFRYSRLTCMMDVAAVHDDITPLRLDDLLAADKFNFIHDITGIARHLHRDSDRAKRYLTGGFIPRFSR